MKSFKQYIAEAKNPEVKGYVNKSGKMVMWRFGKDLRPYHIEGVIKNARKFKLDEHDIKFIMAQAWGFDPDDDEVENAYDDLKNGEVDYNKDIERYLNDKGWARVVIGTYSSIEMRESEDSRSLHAVAKALDKKYGESYIFPLIGYNTITIGKFGFNISNKFDWRQYIKTGKEPGKGRTEIGRTMAQFRDHVEHPSVKSFTKYII